MRHATRDTRRIDYLKLYTEAVIKAGLFHHLKPHFQQSIRMKKDETPMKIQQFKIF